MTITSNKSYAVGVDIGGTFTDCAVVDEAGRVFHGKSLSTHGDTPVAGVLDGLANVAEAAGETLESLLAATDQFNHGTTIGTNLIVERKGARIGLVTTKGHRDALAIMRGRGRTAGEPPDRVLNVRDTDKPQALVPRGRIIEVIERVAVDGSVLVPLDEAAAREALSGLLELDVEAIAIALLWSFRNPVHELRLRELLEELAPGMYVSLSCETAPRQGEFERTVATAINSYIGPDSSRYLEQLESALAAHGLRPTPFIMQANGGVMTVAGAASKPVQTIGSGPAGGLAATTRIAARHGHVDVIATDMGGTSFEVGLLVGGRPVLASENVIDKHTFNVSHLDVRSIACGGGSIARVDPHSGGLQVGPESAGSDPGPACYGNGLEATVTDADVVLGLLDPRSFLGGRMELSRDRAEEAVGRVAAACGLSLEQAAAGILKVNANNAATLIRQRTVEQGLDPRDFAIYAFGGAGPVHAFMFAEELGIDRVVIPMGNGASTLSSYGIAVSDAVHLFEQECSLHAPFAADALCELVQDLETRARDHTIAAGFAPERIRLERSALARYSGQYMQELLLPVGPSDERIGRGIEQAFVEEYTRLYGAAALSPSHVPEIFSLRVTATIELAGGIDPVEAEPAGDAALVATSSRPVFWPRADRWIDTAVHEGPPVPGTLVEGPTLVQLAHTTISVAPGQHLETAESGDCMLFLGQGAEQPTALGVTEVTAP